MKILSMVNTAPWVRKLLEPLAFYGLCTLLFLWRDGIVSISPIMFGLSVVAYFACIPLTIALFVTDLCKTIIEKDKLNLIPTLFHAIASIVLMKLIL